LAIARAPLPEEASYEDLCFHAQQAAEKALKAVYVDNGWTFRYTHDLETLLSGLRQKGMEVPSEILETDVLSRYAWEARYPGLDEPVSEQEYQEAIRMAEAVLTWAATQLGK
jgi:HEPN domain-containing protein